jgi:hypothetical protein
MKTTNLAIVFTDIQGFTERTGRQTHEENRRMLRTAASTRSRGSRTAYASTACRRAPTAWSR